MSVLTDTDIENLLCVDSELWNKYENKLCILNYNENCLTPMGYDLRVGGFYKTFFGKQNLFTLKEGEKIYLKPRDITIVATLEQVKMPQDGSISALILSKVSKVSQGISHISTKVDPGWSEGELLIPIQNLSMDTIQLEYGETFCTIVFFKNQSRPKSLYKNSQKSSRSKFVDLLVRVQYESFLKERILDIIEIFIILGVLIIISFLVIHIHSPQFYFIVAPFVAAAIAVSKLVRSLVNSLWSRR